MKTAESCRPVKNGIMKTLGHAACNALVPVCVLEGRFFSAGGARRRLLVKTRESFVVFPDSEGNQNDVCANEEQIFFLFHVFIFADSMPFLFCFGFYGRQ